MTQFYPKTHRFGMAYTRHGEGKIIYPLNASVDECGQVLARMDDAIIWVTVENLVRSPKHDLIPKSQADKLAEALREARTCLVQEAARLVRGDYSPSYCAEDWEVNIPRIVLKTLEASTDSFRSQGNRMKLLYDKLGKELAEYEGK